ncbi:hypothetical protein [Paenibacillus sp. Root52]|nr:hypothetical protein [Paenibacillus sp. Root52]
MKRTSSAQYTEDTEGRTTPNVTDSLICQSLCAFWSIFNLYMK